MIAVDTNILVAFQRTEYTHHDEAVRIVTALAEGPETWAIPWPCIHEFVAVVTNPRIFRKPTDPAVATDVAGAWMESPTVRLLGEGQDYWPRLCRLIRAGKITGARIHDARIAALCLEHRVRVLWTADRDFSRFPELKCVNPLTSQMDMP
jgi:uncharacterized protein